MPYRRKYRTKRRKRVYRKRSRRAIMYKAPTPRLYFFKRHYDLGVATVSKTVTVSGGFSFQLDEVPNSQEFTELFDLYMINAVKVTAFPSWTSVIPSPQGVAISPQPIRWVSVIDYNSSNGFASLNDAREFQTARVNRLSSMKGSHKRYIYHPRYITGVEEDDNTVVAGGSRRGWLNTTRADVPHYGYRYIIEPMSDPNNITVTPTIEFEAVYYFVFKRVK